MTNKKVKLNDKVTNKNKKQKLNIDKYIADESKEIKRFVIILIGIIIVVLVSYQIANVLKKDKKTSDDSSITAGSIDYDVVSIGTMLNRNENDYYVILYDAKDTNAVLYSAIVSKYTEKENSLKVFFCDLGNELNKNYIAKENSNPNAKSIDEIALGNLTLIKVSKGKIVKYIENIDTIKSELK